jgi:hypothetical protein
LNVSNAEFAGLLSAVNRLQMSGFTVGCEESTIASSIGLNVGVPALPVLRPTFALDAFPAASTCIHLIAVGVQGLAV